MRIDLPNEQSAVIATRGEISERASRAIDDAQLRAIAVSAKLINAGLDANDPKTFAVYDDLAPEDNDKIRGFECVLIVHMVKSWTLGELPTLETVEDLDHETFEFLSGKCLEEFSKVTDFSSEAMNDPKAVTGS